MASATADIQVRRTVNSVTLTLSGPEASALLYLCNQVGGESKNSARGLIDQIAEALVAAGIFTPHADDVKAHNGNIHFVTGSRAAFTKE
jgi:hypothetical protein